jgi:SPP1 gp7 family putative phage head morphogenesis protein
MLQVCEHIHHTLSTNLDNRYDPTRTTVLRNNFVHESNRRFNILIKNIRKNVYENDIFGLRNDIVVFEELPKKVFSFTSDPKKIEEFSYWLERQIELGLLDKWPNKYISDAYKRGILRALYEMRKAKYKVPLAAEIGGEDFVLTLSPHINTLELLYVRVLSELKGITSQMEQQIVRVLAAGFSKGDSASKIARKLVAVINGKGVGDLAITDTLGRFIPARRRAEILARTEIVRAHHLAMIQEYKRWGVEGVNVIVEWQTAGDDKVCPVCSSLEGKTFTIEEAELLIPVHPNCRCCVIPILK